MAESVLRARLAGTPAAGLVLVDSAGTGGWHVGEPADPRTVEVLARHGYACRHTARKFEPADLLRYDLAVALDSGHLRTLRQWGERPGARRGAGRASQTAQLRLLREFDPAAARESGPGGLDVPDPYYGSMAGFEACLAMVEAAVPGLAGHIETRLEAARVGEQ
jgi:protein-tyrosine phosphatase